ncbi:CHAD domain-containing protein [Streptomyces sp. NPDC059637]|uniref:CYTH and CHAD domain-containing protein n=1 Tax=Streptomyces sp. NPDC059637 TaxID=3347752 RepID=UPI0036B87E91
MASTVHEVERKYEAADGVPLPPLDGLPGVARVEDAGTAALDAVYFDTAGLRLAARRITLRSRAGGDDAGWHLKLPSDAPDTRTEVRLPPSGGRDVPAELAAQVARHLRGDRLLPVVRIKNSRERHHLYDADGRLLAEVARDRVTAQLLEPGGRPSSAVTATGWSEIEVELAPGAPRRLLDEVERRFAGAGIRRSSSPSKLLRALGDRAPQPAPPPPAAPGGTGTAGDAAVAYLHGRLLALLAVDPAVRLDEEDAVHRMRVATRRLRSALKTYRRELDRTATDPLAEELKWLAGVLGRERDREVLDARLRTRLGELPAAAGTAAADRRLRDRFAASRAGNRDLLLREMNGARYFRLLDALEELVASPPLRRPARKPARGAAVRALRRESRRLTRRMDAVRGLPPGEERDRALHEARKAAKRARYAAESAAPVLGKSAKKQQKALKKVQKLLGEHQDSVVAREALLRIAAETRADGGDTFPFGAAYQLERHRAAEVEARLPRTWRKARRRMPVG